MGACLLPPHRLQKTPLATSLGCESERPDTFWYPAPRLTPPPGVACLLDSNLLVFSRPSHSPLDNACQLIVRLLRLLQASGVPLDPSTCRWGPAAAAVATAVSGTPGVRKDAAALETTLRASCAWVVGAFEPRRLRASIEGFPIERELEPPAFPFEDAARRGTVGGDGGGGGGRRDGSSGSSSTGRGCLLEVGEEDDGSDGSEGSSDSDSDSNDSGSGGFDDGSDAGSDAEGNGGGDEGLELAVPAGGRGGVGDGPLTEGVAVAGQNAEQVYDPCFVLPLLEWGLRSAGVKAQTVSLAPVGSRGRTRRGGSWDGSIEGGEGGICSRGAFEESFVSGASSQQPREYRDYFSRNAVPYNHRSLPEPQHLFCCWATPVVLSTREKRCASRCCSGT